MYSAFREVYATEDAKWSLDKMLELDYIVSSPFVLCSPTTEPPLRDCLSILSFEPIGMFQKIIKAVSASGSSTFRYSLNVSP